MTYDILGHCYPLAPPPQVFSLATTSSEDGPELKSKNKKNDESNGGGSLLKVAEKGCVFRSYYNGQEIELTPESTLTLTLTLFWGQEIELTPESTVQAQ